MQYTELSLRRPYQGICLIRKENSKVTKFAKGAAIHFLTVKDE